MSEKLTKQVIILLTVVVLLLTGVTCFLFVRLFSVEKNLENEIEEMYNSLEYRIDKQTEAIMSNCEVIDQHAEVISQNTEYTKTAVTGLAEYIDNDLISKLNRDFDLVDRKFNECWQAINNIEEYLSK